MSKKRYNEEFIDILDKLHMLMLKQGEVFRAKAYQKAQNTIVNHKESIFEAEQLKGFPGIGTTIMEKLNEYVQTGKLQVLERENDNPYNLFCEIHGIGPKKAQELVDAGITSISMLRERQDEYLNNVQKTGLKYYEDILKRIPRSEIDEYKNIFTPFFRGSEYTFEIVGSYRRGAKDSGDIDIIISGKDGKMYKKIVDDLVEQKMILEVLSRGTSKTLVIAKLPGKNKTPRRLDFLYSQPNEFAFSTLYFTGSKYFNTGMRQRALDMGYTLNEHGICHMVQGKKGPLIEKVFPNEQSIFSFLGLVYKEPCDRIDTSSIVSL